MSHDAATWDINSAISGLRKLAMANFVPGVAMERCVDGRSQRRPLIRALEKLAMANSRFGSTPQDGIVLAGSVHTAWRQAA